MQSSFAIAPPTTRHTTLHTRSNYDLSVLGLAPCTSITPTHEPILHVSDKLELKRRAAIDKL
jgi:hypothetical protein